MHFVERPRLIRRLATVLLWVVPVPSPSYCPLFSRVRLSVAFRRKAAFDYTAWPLEPLASA